MSAVGRMEMDGDFRLASVTRKHVDAIKSGLVEMKMAIRILKKEHGLTFCQVWIPRGDNHPNNEWVIKFGGYHAAAYKDYYNACVNIQDGSGGLAAKTLETYETYFSRNIIKGKLPETLIPVTPATQSSCCLAICLWNIHTGCFDYGIEFFFSSYDNNNPAVFLESVFSKLESCMPSFKLASGAQLGHELLVLDADNLPQTINILASKKQQEQVDRDARLLQRMTSVKFVRRSFGWAATEIKKALSFMNKNLGLTLCQVWMYPIYINENKKFAVKSYGYSDVAFKGYYDACVKIQDGAGRLAMKTLSTYQPYLSRNILIGELKDLLPATASESTCCLAICLKNRFTGNLDYAFELFFSLRDKDDPSDLLKSILESLKICLPNFKLSSGAPLDDELLVLDADNHDGNFDFLAFLKPEEECTEGLYATKGCSVQAMDVSTSVEFTDLKTKISQSFHLVTNYRLAYLVKTPCGRLWTELKDDEDLKECIRYCTEHAITRLLICVQPYTHRSPTHRSPTDTATKRPRLF